MASGGKGGGAGGNATDYYGTIIGLVCAGPVDELVSIVCDSKTVWPDWPAGVWRPGAVYVTHDRVRHNYRVWKCVTGHTASDGNAPGVGDHWVEYSIKRTDSGVGNPVFLTIPGYGFAYFYWGTEDQNFAYTFTYPHPSYRRQCFVVLKDFLFGRERTSAPNVEVVVRRAPQQAVITGSPARLDDEHQANVLAQLAEAITHPVFGLGQDPDLIDAPSWQATAAALTDVAYKTHLSPVLNQGETLAALAGLSVDYVDAWLRWSRDGRIEAGLFAGSSPVITEADLVDEPQFDAEGWGDTSSQARVQFMDRDRAYKESVATASSTFNRAVTGEPKVTTLSRPWIIRGAQAAAYAAEYVRRYAEPGLSGTITVRGPKAEGIEPGCLFTLTHSRLGLSIVCRCLEKSADAPPADRVSIAFENNRANAAENFQPGIGSPAEPTDDDPEIISRFRFVHPPPGLSGGSQWALAVLAARTKPDTTSMRVHLRQADGTMFYALGRQTSFAVTGLLADAYASSLPADGTAPPDDDSEALHVTWDPETPPYDLGRMQTTQTADAVNDGALILWVFRAAGGLNEVMIVKAMRIVGPDAFYRLKVRRAQFGTRKLTFAPGDRAFLLFRDDLVLYEHASFESFATSGTPATLRLQARNPWNESDLANTSLCPDRSFTFADPYAPDAEWLSVQRSGVEITDYAEDFGVGDSFSASAQFTGFSPLIEGSLIARLGAIVRTVWTGALSGLASPAITAAMTFDALGDWRLLAVVRDSAGRKITRELTVSGTPTPIRVRAPRVSLPWLSVGSLAGGTLRNDFTGFLGHVVAVGSKDIVVTHLGRWVVSGNSGTETVTLIRESDGALIGSVSVGLTGATVGAYAYAALGSTVTLAAGVRYYLVGSATAAGNEFYDNGPAVVPLQGFTFPEAVYETAPGVYSAFTSANTCYGPLGMKCLTAQTEPPSMSPPGGGYATAQTVTLSSATGGAVIEYQIVALGAAAGGSWTTYSGPVSVPLDRSLIARASKSGLPDSPTFTESYWTDPSA